MNIVIINGSPRKKGRTGIAARYIEKKFSAALIDLSVNPLPIFNGEKDQDDLEAVKKLREKVALADGIVFASPEYHNGMSGALKNALDYLGGEYFSNKPVALVAVAGGGKGGINALNNMRTVGRGLYANVIPRQLVLDPPCFDSENDTLNQPAGKMIDQLMDDLGLYMESFAVMKAKWKEK